MAKVVQLQTSQVGGLCRPALRSLTCKQRHERKRAYRSDGTCKREIDYGGEVYDEQQDWKEDEEALPVSIKSGAANACRSKVDPPEEDGRKRKSTVNLMVFGPIIRK